MSAPVRIRPLKCGTRFGLGRRRPMHHPGKPRMGRVRRTRSMPGRDPMTTVYTCDPDVHWTHTSSWNVSEPYTVGWLFSHLTPSAVLL